MKRLSILFVLIVFLFSACEQQDKKESYQLENGVSKNLNDSRKERIGNILYTLILNITGDKNETIKGGIQIDFQLKNSEGPLALDFNTSGDNILRVLVNGKEGEYDFENGHIVLHSTALIKGKNEVKVDFNVNSKALKRTDDYLYSSFAPNKASTVFPCFDQPNLKALFSLNLMLPPGWTAISNAPLRSVDKGAERVLHQFTNTKPISTYLFGFVAGRFEKLTREKKQRTINIFHLKKDSKKLTKDEDYLFDLQFNALEWMEAYTKIAYPFQKFDLLLLPSLQENYISWPGLVIANADELLFDGKSSAEQDMVRAKTIASGTAQMYYGNLVSIDWFNNAWVPDVLTDYLSSKMVNPSFFSIYHDLEFLTNHFPKALEIDRTLGNHPIQQQCNNSADADLLTDAITQHKAPIIFRQLEKIVTEEKMRTGLIDYLKKYSFSNAGWDELLAILDSKTHDDLKVWSDIWFKKAGMPEYKAFQEFDMYVINQYDQNYNDVVWPQSLYLYKKWPGGWQNKEVWDDKQRFEFPIQEVDIVILNWDAYAYGYFFLNNREKNFLLTKRMFELDPVRRGVSYISLWENMLRDNLLPLDMRNALEHYLVKENQIANIRLLLSYYEKMFWRYSNEKQREQWAETMEPILWKKMINATTAEEKYAFYNTFTKTAISSDGIKKMLDLWHGEITIPDLKLSDSDHVSLAFKLAVRMDLPSTDMIPNDILEQQKQLTKSADLLARLNFVSPAVSASEGVRSSYFEKLKSPDNWANEAFVLEAMRYLHHPLRAQAAEKDVLPSLEMLDEISEADELMFPKHWLDAVFYGYRTSAVVETANNFLSGHPNLNPKLKQKVQQAIDPVQRAVNLETEFEDQK